jgi:acyl carrier protein
MRTFSASEIRVFVVGVIEEQLAMKGYPLEDVSDDFDLLTSGVIDSLSFLELTVALQEEFDVELDFDEIDPEQFSIIGPLCQYITCKKKEALTVANGQKPSYAKARPEYLSMRLGY